MIIPDKLKVGFQERDDTYLGKLAFITYYNMDGSLRGEKSFQSWVNNKIDKEEFENKPQKGYILNKGVKRFSSFGENNQKIRIFDPRGFEFEITVDNLLEITQYSNINFQEIEQECIFGWNGNQVYLVPTNISEYKNHLENKKTQEDVKVFGKKDTLTVGYTYATKSMPYLYYVGKIDKEDYFLTDKNNFTKVRKVSIIAQTSTVRKGNHESLVEISQYLVGLLSSRKWVYSLKDSLKDEIISEIIECFKENLKSYEMSHSRFDDNKKRVVSSAFYRAMSSNNTLLFNGQNCYDYQSNNTEYNVLYNKYYLSPDDTLEKIKALLRRDIKINILEFKNGYSLNSYYVKLDNIKIEYDSLEEFLENYPLFISEDCVI